MILHALLDDAARFGPAYGDGLASHLPMGLVALWALGADPPRLQAFARTEAAHPRPAPAAQAWPAGDLWQGHLGDIEAWPACHDLFSQWLAATDVHLIKLVDACRDEEAAQGGHLWQQAASRAVHAA